MGGRVKHRGGWPQAAGGGRCRVGSGLCPSRPQIAATHLEGPKDGNALARQSLLLLGGQRRQHGRRPHGLSVGSIRLLHGA